MDWLKNRVLNCWPTLVVAAVGCLVGLLMHSDYVFTICLGIAGGAFASASENKPA